MILGLQPGEELMHQRGSVRVDRHRAMPIIEMGQLWGEVAAVTQDPVDEQHRRLAGASFLVPQPGPVPHQPRHGTDHCSTE
jgi:hypothetical protein